MDDKKDNKSKLTEKKFEYYAPEELSKEKKNNVNLFLITAIILFIFTVTISGFYFYEQYRNRIENEKIQANINELNNQLNEIKNEREKLENQSNIQSEELIVLKRKLLEKERKIAMLIKIEKDYNVAKTEIGELKSLNIEYLKRIDSLITLNKILKLEVQNLKTNLTSAIEQNKTLSERLTKIEEKAKIIKDPTNYPILVENFSFKSFNAQNIGKKIETFKAKKVNQFNSCFNIKNKEQLPVKIIALIRYIGPDGEILNPNKNFPLISENGLEKKISLKRTFDLNEPSEVCMNFEPDNTFDFKIGNYISELFITLDEKEYIYIAHSQLILK